MRAVGGGAFPRGGGSVAGRAEREADGRVTKGLERVIIKSERLFVDYGRQNS